MSLMNHSRRFFFISFILIFFSSILSCGGLGRAKRTTGTTGDNSTPSGINCAESAYQNNSPFAAGSGTSTDPYIICTRTQLQQIPLVPAYSSAHYKQMANIDFSGGRHAVIGNWTTEFTGVYDGNDYTISNFAISDFLGDSIGMFGVVSGASTVIKNVNLSGITLDGIGNGVGALVGYLYSGATVQNCTLSGTILIEGDTYVGGLIGMVDGGYVTDSHVLANGTISAPSIVGGFIGDISNATITTSSVIATGGSLSATGTLDYIGGFVGHVSDSDITLSSADSVIASGQDNIGGFVGFSENNANFENSYARNGEVEAVTRGGGFAGMADSNTSFTTSYAVTNITRTSGASALFGYFIASDGVINDGYSISDCYSATDIVISPVFVFQIAIGEEHGWTNTQANLKIQGSYAGTWNFTSIWILNPGSFPELR